jgi:hypothetical protein
VGFAAVAAGTVAKRQGVAVSFGDLAAESESDARAAGLGGEERNEEVGWIGDAGAIVLNHDLDRVGRGWSARRCATRPQTCSWKPPFG